MLKTMLKMDVFLRLVAIVAGLVVTSDMAFCQTYSPLHPPNSSQSYVAYCRLSDGSRVPYCYMRLYTGIYLNTNGHFHDDPSRPFSTVTPSSGRSDGSGYLAFTLRTTQVGQAETILVNDYAAGLWGNKDYAVGYGDIYWNSHPEMWDLVGGTDTGADTGHGTTGYNHWMQIHAAYGIYYASNDYLAEHPEQSRLCMNDMGLPFGGKFDINRNWNSPHAAHDRGTAVDVGSAGARQCNASNALPTARMQDFKQKCIDYGADPMRSIVHYDSAHVHCYWNR